MACRFGVTRETPGTAATGSTGVSNDARDPRWGSTGHNDPPGWAARHWPEPRRSCGIEMSSEARQTAIDINHRRA